MGAEEVQNQGSLCRTDHRPAWGTGLVAQSACPLPATPGSASFPFPTKSKSILAASHRVSLTRKQWRGCPLPPSEVASPLSWASGARPPRHPGLQRAGQRLPSSPSPAPAPALNSSRSWPLWVRLLHFILKLELPVLSESPPWPDIRPTYPFCASHIHGAPLPAALQPRGLTGCRNRHSLGERGPDGRRGGHMFPPRALALTSPSARGKPPFLCGRSSPTDRPIWKGRRVMWEGNPQLHTRCWSDSRQAGLAVIKGKSYVLATSKQSRTMGFYIHFPE